MYVRARRARAESDAALDSLETLGQPDITDWHRIALVYPFSVEAGHLFAGRNIRGELDEAGRVWSRLHQGSISDATLIAALNERPAPSPALRTTAPLSSLCWIGEAGRRFISATWRTA